MLLGLKSLNLVLILFSDYRFNIVFSRIHNSITIEYILMVLGIRFGQSITFLIILVIIVVVIL